MLVCRCSRSAYRNSFSMLTCEIRPLRRLLTDGWYSSKTSASRACVYPFALTCSKMADRSSALILSALASDAENPRTSKTLPRTTCVGLFSTAFFMTLLLLQSLSDEFEALTRNCDVPPIRFATFLLKTVQYVDSVFNLRKVNHSVPCALIGFLQFVDARSDGTYLPSPQCRFSTDLQLPERESKRPFNAIRESRQNFQRVPFKMEFGGWWGVLAERHRLDRSPISATIQYLL